MSRGQLQLLKTILRAGSPSESLPVERVRANFDRLLGRFPEVPGLEVESLEVADRPAEWLGFADGTTEAAILFLHGGGFLSGSLDSHRQTAARLARAAGCRCLNLDYRRSPESHWPAALEDAGAALDWLFERFAPERLVVAGDSAGANLAVLAVVDRLREGKSPPAAIAALCPWGDLTGGTPSLDRHAELDPMVQRPGLLHMAAAYLDGQDPWHPRVTPLRADLGGLPPLHVQAGSDDALLDDAVALAERAVRAGVDVDLSVWAGMTHVWHLFGGRLEEADEALDAAGAFLAARLARAETDVRFSNVG